MFLSRFGGFAFFDNFQDALKSHNKEDYPAFGLEVWSMMLEGETVYFAWNARDELSSVIPEFLWRQLYLRLEQGSQWAEHNTSKYLERLSPRQRIEIFETFDDCGYPIPQSKPQLAVIPDDDIPL